MKIRNLSKLALAVAISSSVVLEGCKKYDDDITRLEQLIGGNTADIAAMKTQLASLASTMVVQSVSSVDGGFDIVFKKPDGSTVSYQIRNGAKGDAGTPGTPGTPGAPGTKWEISEDGFWQSSNDNGATWTKTSVKAQGEAGEAGQNGITPEIKEEGGKYYWFVNGVNTGTLAYPGEITMVATQGGWNVVFTTSDNKTENLFLATEQVAVSNLNLVPKYLNNNSPVVFFPRIVDDASPSVRNTKMQGSAVIKYNVNPYGVNPEFYNITGVLEQATESVTFRSTGSGAAVSKNFSIVESLTKKTYGDITVFVKPTGKAKDIFPQRDRDNQLHLALQINNLKGAANQKHIASAYTLVKEEFVTVDDLTIEKFVTDANGNIKLSDSYAALEADLEDLMNDADQVDFPLSIIEGSTNDGALKLNEKLKGFYYRHQVGGKTESMDDNGLNDYKFKYTIQNDEEDPILQKITFDAATGVMKVNNDYSAVGGEVYVKVEMINNQATSNNVLATRYVKVRIVRNYLPTVSMSGTSEVTLGADANIVDTAVVNNLKNLSAILNTAQITQGQFEEHYNVASVKVTKGTTTYPNTGSNGISFTMDPDKTVGVVSVGKNVMPGTYKVVADIKSGDDYAYAPIQLTLTVTVKAPILDYSKVDIHWDADAARVVGKVSGSSWTLTGDHADFIDVPSYANIINVYSIGTTDNVFADVTNSTIGLDMGVAKAKEYINTNKTVTVTLKQYLGQATDTRLLKTQTYAVKFINPVAPIIALNNASDTIVDNGQAINVDFRRFVEIRRQANNNLIYRANVSYDTDTYKHVLAGWNAVDQNDHSRFGLPFTVSGTRLNLNLSAVEQVGTYLGVVNASNLASATATTLPASVAWAPTNAFSTAHATFHNTGTSTIQQTITLVYKVKYYNTFNTGTVASTKDQVEQLVFVVVKPNN